MVAAREGVCRAARSRAGAAGGVTPTPTTGPEDATPASTPDVSCRDVVGATGAECSDREVPRPGTGPVVSVLPAPVDVVAFAVIGAAGRLVVLAGNGECAAELSRETEAGAVDPDGATAVVIGLPTSPLDGIAGGATPVTG